MGCNIGCSTPQHNPWTADWVTFFRDHRLGFQLKLIKEQYGDNDLYAKGEHVKGRQIPLGGILLRVGIHVLENASVEENETFLSTVGHPHMTGQRLLEKLPLLLQGLDNVQPCLLHGDLWSGNVVADSHGSPVILDPACYCMSLFFSQILESCLVSEISSLNCSITLAC